MLFSTYLIFADQPVFVGAKRSDAVWCAARALASIVGVYPDGSAIPPATNCSGSTNRRIFGFRNPLNSPALPMVIRATQASIQQPSSEDKPSPSTDSIPHLRTLSSASQSRSRPPKRLSLSLQKPTFRIALARFTSARSQMGSSSITGTGDTLATFALASQSSARHGCSNNSIPVGSSVAAKRQASASE